MSVRFKVNKAKKTPLDHAKAKLLELKIRAPRRPLDGRGKPLNPQLPHDLTLLNDIQLGKLHSEMACLAQYAKLQLAMMAVSTATAKMNDRLVRAKVRCEKSGTVSDKDMRVDLDRRTKQSGLTVLVDESTELLTKAVLEGYLLGRDATSREMTRRQKSEFNRVQGG